MLSSIAARLALLRKPQRGNLGDALYQLLALLFGVSILAIMFGIVFETWVQSAPSRQAFGWGFLWSTAFDPPKNNFGALPFIYGTIGSSILAILIAGPIGIGIAAYLVEIAPRRLNQVVGFVVELLAAVPSIVFGFWGIIVLAPWLKSYVVPPLQVVLGWTSLFSGPFFGPSVFAAGLVLALMILPTVVAFSRDVLRAVPAAQREGMLALGATRWEMFGRAVLPYGKSGITGAVILGLGQAAGETMAVTLIIGNSPKIFTSLFDQGATMASIIANNFAESGGLFLSSLIEIGLILFAVTFLINLGARLLVSLISRQPEGGIRA